MAEFSEKYQEGFRDSYPVWVTVFVHSLFNFKPDALKQQLNTILIPWNSTMEQTVRAGGPPSAVYKFTYGAASFAAAETVAEQLLARFNEMEERIAEVQRFSEPLEWIADERD